MWIWALLGLILFAAFALGFIVASAVALVRLSDALGVIRDELSSLAFALDLAPDLDFDPWGPLPVVDPFADAPVGVPCLLSRPTGGPATVVPSGYSPRIVAPSQWAS